MGAKKQITTTTDVATGEVLSTVERNVQTEFEQPPRWTTSGQAQRAILAQRLRCDVLHHEKDVAKREAKDAKDRWEEQEEELRIMIRDAGQLRLFGDA